MLKINCNLRKKHGIVQNFFFFFPFLETNKNISPVYIFKRINRLHIFNLTDNFHNFYNWRVQAHNRLVADLDSNSMEVVETQSFATEVTTALEKLKEKDVRIILGNFNETWARRIFCEAHKYKTLNFWLKILSFFPTRISLPSVYYVSRFDMFGRKYQWVIMGTYTEEWWLHPDEECNSSDLVEALHGAILTDLLPITTEKRKTIAGIVSWNGFFEI